MDPSDEEVNFTWDRDPALICIMFNTSDQGRKITGNGVSPCTGQASAPPALNKEFTEVTDRSHPHLPPYKLNSAAYCGPRVQTD